MISSFLPGSLTGNNTRNPAQPNLDFLLVEEGAFESGRWKPVRRLNGDETAHLKLDRPGMLHVSFFTYI